VVMIGTEIRVKGAVCEHIPDHPPQGLAASIPRRRSSACATARALPAARLDLQGPPAAQGAGFRRDAKTTSTTRSPASAAWSDPEGRAPCSAE
jgi:hypothetical protein